MSDENGGSNSGRAIAGCGGCGCLLALLLLCGGGGLAGFATANASHMHEAILPGYATALAGSFVGLIALIVLIIGVVLGKKKS